MPIRIKCPADGCGEVFQVGDEMVGEVVECPFCGSGIRVKRPEQSPQTQGAAQEFQRDQESQVCSNCGAVIGAQESVCPECGAGLQGAGPSVPRQRRSRNWRPLLVGVGAAVILIALIGVGIYAITRLLGGEEAEPKPVAEEQPVEQPAGEQPTEGPETPQAARLRVDLPDDLSQALTDNEEKATENATAFKEKLRETLQQVGGAARGSESANAWADLYTFCADRGMNAEAEMCWYRAAMLAPDDREVNQKLGRTATYRGHAVTPEQRDFLQSLQPTVTLINSAPALDDATATVAGRQVALDLGESVEVQVNGDLLQVEFSGDAESEEQNRSFAMPVNPGLDYEVEVMNTSAAPFLPYQELQALYPALSGGRTGGDVEVRRAGGGIAWARAGGLTAERIGNTPVSANLEEDVLTIVGYITLGDPFSEAGRHGLIGTSARPIKVKLFGQQSVAVVQEGTYTNIHLDLAEPIWGALGVADGKMSAEWARNAATDHAQKVADEHALMIARGEMVRQDVLYRRCLDRLEAVPGEVAARRDLMRRAAAKPAYLDRVRALGLKDRQQHLYMNWPRYRLALAAALRGARDDIMARVNTMPTRTEEELERGLPEVESVNPQFPSPVYLTPAELLRVRMQVAPVLGDDVVIEQARQHWEEMEPEARVSALMSLEMVGTGEAVSLIGEYGSQTRQQGLVQMVLMALGSVGTAEAIEAIGEIPTISGEVRTAIRAARTAAGQPEVLDEVESFLRDATGEQKELFLWLITQTATPGTLLALADSVSGCEDPYDTQRVAAGLVRIGGVTATGELARLMALREDRFPQLARRISADAAPPVMRRVLNGLAENSKAMAEALQDMNSDLSWKMLELFASRGNSAAVGSLLQRATPQAIEAATEGAGSIEREQLQWLRDRWIVGAPEDEQWRWRGGVPQQQAAAFVDRVYRQTDSPRTKLAAFVILSKLGRRPDLADIVELAKKEPNPATGKAQTAEPEVPESETPEPDRGEPEGDIMDMMERRGGERDERERRGPGPERAESEIPGMDEEPTAEDVSPPGFEEPQGVPHSAYDLELSGDIHLFVLGLLRDIGDANAVSALRELAEGYHHGAYKTPAMVALAQAGGPSELTFLRNALAQRSSSYANLSEWANELESRMAAMHALAMVQDSEWLNQAPDLLVEQPPGADSIQGTVDSYELHATWWKRKLDGAVCRALARTCRRQAPHQLTGDEDVSDRIVFGLRAIVEQYEADDPDLTTKQRELRNEAVVALGRVVDWNEQTHRVVINLLAEAVVDAERTPGLSELRRAVLNALAHIASRQMGDEKLLDALRSVQRPAGRETFLNLAQEMAAYAPPEFFNMLAALPRIIRERDHEERVAIVKEVPPELNLAGPNQARWVAGALQRIASDLFAPQMPRLVMEGYTGGLNEDEIEPYINHIVETHGYGLADVDKLMEDVRLALPRGAGYRMARELVTEKVREMLEEQGDVYREHPWMERLTERGEERREGDLSASRMREEDLRRARMQMIQERMDELMEMEEQPYLRLDRRLAQHWAYSLYDIERQLERQKVIWRLADLLFQNTPSVIAAEMEEIAWLNGYPISPALAVRYAEADGGGTGEAIAQLRSTLLVGRSMVAENVLAEVAYSSPTAHATATAGLRRIGTGEAAQALWDGLVGPHVGTFGPEGGPEMPEISETQAMLEGAGILPEPPPEVYCARALGSMGRGDRLRDALSAEAYEFFLREALMRQWEIEDAQEDGRPVEPFVLTVRRAALEGIAYMPQETGPVPFLVNLLQRATQSELKQAVARAISTALQLPAIEQRLEKRE